MGETAVNQKVVAWAHSRLRQKVGRGECWDLAHQALRSAGARSSTSTGRDDNYVWGKPVQLERVVPGDVIQFRDWIVTTKTVTVVRFADGSGYHDSDEVVARRPHHTAIVDRVGGVGVLRVYEQHVKPGGNHVQLHEVATKSTPPIKIVAHKMLKNAAGKVEIATVSTVKTMVVSGSIWAYRPQPQ